MDAMPATLPPALAAPQPVLVAVSGGVDSVALLHWLRQWSHLSLHVAHYDHGLRPESFTDAEFVAELVAGLGLPFSRGRAPAGLADQPGSLEDNARTHRYAFLADLLRVHQCRALLTAHHADDQAETVLMHLIRGSGLAGLRGMRVVTPLHALGIVDADLADRLLVRPLLATPRSALIDYCEANGLTWREDPTNTDPRFFRNRIRHQLMPLLAELNPQIVAGLGRTATVLHADYTVITAAIDQAWELLVCNTALGHALSLRRAGWLAAPLGVRLGVLRRALNRLRPGLRDIDLQPLMQATDTLPDAREGQQYSLPGDVLLTADREYLHLHRREAGLPPLDTWPWFDAEPPLALAAPGDTLLPGSGWRVQIDVMSVVPHHAVAHNADDWLCYIDAEALPAPLSLRRWQPGDVIRPLGMRGRRQLLADLFTNAAVPLALRAHLPLLMAGHQLVWVPGLRLDHRARVTHETCTCWRVQCRPPQAETAP